MKYNNLKISSDKDFRRVTGVKRQTFYTMIEILKKAHQDKKAKGGRPNKLSIEDMLLMGLEYLREYRTYLSISTKCPYYTELISVSNSVNISLSSCVVVVINCR